MRANKKGMGIILAQLLKFFAVECRKGDNAQPYENSVGNTNLKNDF